MEKRVTTGRDHEKEIDTLAAILHEEMKENRDFRRIALCWLISLTCSVFLLAMRAIFEK
jgi:hypothetical protein